jgi:hypothetical protein
MELPAPGQRDDTHAKDRDAVRSYEAALLASIRELTAGMRRAAALVRALEAPDADPELRGMAVAECQSWRAILDHIPAEPPAVYGRVHARVVRWSAVVAALGDLQVTALASGNPADQQRVGQMAADVAARYRDIMSAMEQLANEQRRGNAPAS